MSPPRTRSAAKRAAGGERVAQGGVYAMSRFPYHLPYARLDLRAQPHLYRPGVGEQGVLMVEPYKSELLPHWRFKDPATARESSALLRQRFDEYVAQGDFVGADMARKFIQVSGAGRAVVTQHAHMRSPARWALRAHAGTPTTQVAASTRTGMG